MAAGAAPEVPALAALLVSMAAAVTWLVATGSLEIWRRSLGKLLVWMADTLDRASISILGRSVHLFGPLTKMLRSLVHTVDHYLGEAVIWSGKAASTFFGWFLTINLWMAREIADLSLDVWHALETSTVTTVTRVTKVVTHTVVKPITKTVTVVGKVSTAGLSALNRQVGTLRRQVAHLAAATAGAIAAPWPRIRGLERRADRQAKRLTKLERGALAGVGAAIVWTALRRLGLQWLRCSNTVKTGKRLCGMDPDLLETLLAGSLLLVGSISLVELARELREPTELVQTAMHGLIREL